MSGSQRAWVRRSDGGWISVVDVAAVSGNGHSRVNMTLWLASNPESVGYATFAGNTVVSTRIRSGAQ